MDTKDRRKEITKILQKAGKPVSASSLAKELGVSRQVIVGDVAILRAKDIEIQSTPRGYVMVSGTSFPYVGTVVCNHSKDQLLDELNTICDFGGTCIDVTIEHHIYGNINGQLNISSRYDALIFSEKITDDSMPLSILSGGVHSHKIGCESEEIFGLICSRLKELGILCE